MSTRVREIYYYAVCFVTLIICIFALTGLVNALTQIAFPYPQYSPSRAEMIRQSEALEAKMKDGQTLEQLIAEELQMQVEREKQAQRNQIARDLSRHLSLIIVSLPLYIYHWRRIRRMEN